MCFNLFGFTLQILPARQSTCPLRSQRPFHLLQRQYATHQYFFHTENGQPLRMLAGTARMCFNLFGFTLQILPARQSTCPLRSQRPFHLLQRQYATHQYFFHTENGQPLRCVARTARICFNLFGFYFADSVCTAIGLPSASRISGCLPSVTHSLVTTTFFACSKDGTSYMVCTKMLSMMERRPLAPVFR